MKSVSQLFVGLLTAVGSSLLVLAAATIAILEGEFALLPTPIPTAVEISSPTVLVETTISGNGAQLSPTPTAVVLLTETSEPVACQFPGDWGEYTVLPGDTLDLLASEVGIAAEEIYTRNCLDSTFLISGMILRLPNPAPTSTVPPALPTAAPQLPTAQQCGPYPGWVVYIVRPGDNIFRLSLSYGISQESLRFANCLSSNTIYAGQRLYVPNTPTLTPRASRTATITATIQPSKTVPASTVTVTSTPTLLTTTPTNTATSTPTSTTTSTPTSTPTATPSSTPTSTPSPTPTFTPTVTNTSTPTATSTNTPEGSEP